MELLKRGTTHCPGCHSRLLWEQVPGVMLKREVDGQYVYSAKCSGCGLHYNVKV